MTGRFTKLIGYSLITVVFVLMGVAPSYESAQGAQIQDHAGHSNLTDHCSRLIT